MAAVYGSGCATSPWTSMPSLRRTPTDIAQPALGLGMGGDARVALRREDQEAGRRGLGARADLVQERGADDGLVRDHEHVGRAALAGQVDDDVLDGHVAGGAADAIDDVAPHPAGALLGMGRDDDLVRRRLELAERVADRVDRVGLDDETVGRDAVAAQQLERPVQAAPGGSAARRLVDEVAVARLRDRADDGDPDRPLLRAAVERLDQALARNGLVRDHEDVARLCPGLGGANGAPPPSARAPIRPCPSPRP